MQDGCAAEAEPDTEAGPAVQEVLEVRSAGGQRVAEITSCVEALRENTVVPQQASLAPQAAMRDEVTAQSISRMRRRSRRSSPSPK